MAGAAPTRPSYLQTARDLAEAHRRVDPATTTILLLADDFPSVVVLLSPDEWADVEAGRLALPPGWDLRVRQAL